MKAVIYHADATRANKEPLGFYKSLILGLKENLKKFNIPLIHITLNGFEGYGDINYFYEGDPDNINWNREIFFIDFLKNHAEENEIYFFTEPDARIVKMFPELDGDVSMTVHNKEKRFTPQWRLAKKSALPFFEKALTYYREDKSFWGGDTEIYWKIYDELGQPQDFGSIEYEGVKIDLRKYKEYNMPSSVYTQQYKSNRKYLLVPEAVRTFKKNKTENNI